MAETALVDTRDPRMVMRERFETRKTELRNMLPPDISPDVFIRAIMTSTQLNSDLLACTWQSIWDACARSCRAGLLPDGVEAAIVPYKTRATFIPMVQGVLRSVRRSGQLKWIKADVVRQGEVFTHEVTQEGEIFRHVPGENFQAPIIRAYCVAMTKDGGFYCAVMSRAEIDKHRSFSRASREDSPWNVWYEAMAIKTAIHRLGKVLPSVRDAISEDETIVEPTPAIRATEHMASLEPATGLPSAPEASEGGGEQDGDNVVATDADDDMTAPLADVVSTTEPAAAVDSSVADAYRRGQQDKARGAQRKALPGEYRAPTATRLALAWQAGFDGKEIPTFTENK